MHAFYGTARGVVHIAEGGIPLKSNGDGTGYAGFGGYAAGGWVAGKMLGEDATVVVLLLVLGQVDGEALFGPTGIHQ